MHNWAFVNRFSAQNFRFFYWNVVWLLQIRPCYFMLYLFLYFWYGFSGEKGSVLSIFFFHVCGIFADEYLCAGPRYFSPASGGIAKIEGQPDRLHGDASKTIDSGSSASNKPSGNGDIIVTDECGGEFTDPRDGQSYKTVKIGSRCWFAENLNYADETAVPNMKNNHFCPSGKTENCEKFGRLYNWSTAIDSAAVFKKQEVVCSNTNQCFAEEPIQGLCPDGWRMSSMDDWFNLMSELKNNFYSLQQTGYPEWGNATNSSGFSAVPVGFIQAGAYDNVGTQAGFWTTSQSTTYAQWAGFVVISSDEIVPGEGDKSNYAFAVRCLK